MKVLIVDDNAAVRTALEVLLSIHGIDSVGVDGPDEALAEVDRSELGVVIQDMNFTGNATTGEEGTALFEAIRERDPDLPVVLLTAWTHLEQAVSLVKGGAADYLEKPWDDAKLVSTVRNLLKLRAATEENRRLTADRRAARTRMAVRFDLCGLVYESDAMQELLAMATQVAPAEVPVLVTGPNGSGKEKIADILQANSKRAGAPYVKVNVGALPGDLLESELFGAEAGAFTGADRARPGRFEAADGGTLFLDEIGNLPLSGQVKLLRVLQTGEFERLGSTRSRKVSVRVVSATNADLARMVADGEFREDLYYRLNVIEVRVPGLAERPDDVLPIARSFLPEGVELSSAAERALLSYHWPGNVRELSNRIQRAAILCSDGEIRPTDLDLGAQTSQSGAHRALREPDRDEIARALESADWNISVAARMLGLSRQALYRRIDRYGLGRN